MLVAARRSVETLLEGYDRLVAEVSAYDEPWVVSHGETHSANFIEGADGLLYLIDWDTVRLAPRERDLAGWGRNQDSEEMSAYRRTAGPVTMRPGALRLFHMWWDVSEICGYAHHFRRQHSGSLDDEASWADLERYLKVESKWPELF
jgi:spectinomycin phosphotransferase